MHVVMRICNTKHVCANCRYLFAFSLIPVCLSFFIRVINDLQGGSPCSLTSDGGGAQTAARPGPAITGKFDLGVGESISI
jgi:hypothetical protein